MKKNTTGKLFALSLIILALAACRGPGNNENPAQPGNSETVKTLITAATLESVGFEHTEPSCFDLLFSQDHLYVFNYKDFMVVKFAGGSPVNIFKAQKGKEPRKMLAPRSIFFYDSQTIGIFDYEKASVLLLDLDLNYSSEIQVPQTFYEITRTGAGLVSFLFRQDHVFALLDSKFNIREGFVYSHKKVPFKGFYPRFLNQGFFAGGSLVVHSHWLQPEEKCNIDIYDLKKKKLEISLTWRQPFALTRENFETRHNLYFTIFVAQLGQYYAVQNSILKSMSQPRAFELLMFGDNGKLLFQRGVPHRLIRTQKFRNDTMVYVIDDNGNISSVDVQGFLAQAKGKTKAAK